MGSQATRLIFVYNADSGLFNLAADMAHKLFSPSTYPCQLCALTHSTLTMRTEWRDFLAGLGIDLQFLHRDEFRTRYAQMAIELPAVLCVTEAGPHLCVDASTLNACRSLADLKRLISLALTHSPP